MYNIICCIWLFLVSEFHATFSGSPTFMTFLLNTYFGLYFDPFQHVKKGFSKFAFLRGNVHYTPLKSSPVNSAIRSSTGMVFKMCIYKGLPYTLVKMAHLLLSWVMMAHPKWKNIASLFPNALIITNLILLHTRRRGS